MKAKKIFVGILIFAVLMICFGITFKVNAAGLDLVTITEERKYNAAGVTYKHRLDEGEDPGTTKVVWKLATCYRDNAGTIQLNPKSSSKYAANLYCLRAGLGFTANNATQKAVAYNNSVILSSETFANLTNDFGGHIGEKGIFDRGNEQNYYQMLWVLDNMLLEDDLNNAQIAYTVEDAESETIKGTNSYTQFLIDYADYTKEELDTATNKELARNVLTPEDIEVIQQLVIWYYTNSGDPSYHPASGVLSTIYMASKGDTPEVGPNYDMPAKKEFLNYGDRYNYTEDPDGLLNNQGYSRQDHAETLFANLLAKAKAKVEENGNKYTAKRTVIMYYANAVKTEQKQQPIVEVIEYKEKADVALRKFVSKVERDENGDGVLENIPFDSRVPNVDTTNFYSDNENTTAKYNHKKYPYVSVELGDKVTYTLRIYNEGEIPVRIKEITDYLPPYLTLDDGEWDMTVASTPKTAVSSKFTDPVTGEKNSICKVVNVGTTYGTSDFTKANQLLANGKTAADNLYLDEVVIPARVNNNIEGKDHYTLSYIDVEVECRVSLDAEYDKAITNIAEITDFVGVIDGVDTVVTDRDSETGNVNVPHKNTTPNYSSLPTYKNPEEGNQYVEGQQDDDDYDKLIIKAPEVDLALRKFITEKGDTLYNDENRNSRAPKVDTSELQNGAETATYNHECKKEPVPVEIGDVVTYTIRVYNEGKVAGYVTKITDYVDKNLEYQKEYKGVQEDYWTVVNDEEDPNTTKANKIVTKDNCPVVRVGKITSSGEIIDDPRYDLSSRNVPFNTVKLDAYDKTNDVLSFLDVQIRLMVKDGMTKTTKLTNIAEITEEKDENNRTVVEDRDSNPGNVIVPPNENLDNEKDLPTYKDTEIGKKEYIEGQQDDDDFEKLVFNVPEVDLAIRKFITEADGKTPEHRIPEPNTDRLDKYIDTTAKYDHLKTPIIVKRGKLVTYTMRIYNEGGIPAYAEKITDTLPKYLEYVEDNEINQKYKWDYDEETRVVSTTITAKDNLDGAELYKDRINEDRPNGKLLLAHTEGTALDFIDVQIVCKVADDAIRKY